MAKIQKLQLDSDKLLSVAIEAFDEQNYEKAVLFAKKAIEVKNDIYSIGVLATIYEDMGAFGLSKNIMLREFDKTKDEECLYIVAENLVEENDFIPVIKYYRNYKLDLKKINVSDFSIMNEMFAVSDNDFEVAFPPTDEYLLRMLQVAKARTEKGDYLGSNQLLDFRDYSHLEYYGELIKQKAINYVMLGDLDSLIQYCYTLIDGKYEAYARAYLVYCYNQYGFIGSAKVQMDRLMEVEIPDDLLIELPKILGNTEFNNESLKIADMLVEKQPYSSRMITYRAMLYYIVGDVIGAVKEINRSESLFDEVVESYFLKRTIKSGTKWNSVGEMIANIYVKTNVALDAFASDVKERIKDEENAKFFEFCLKCNDSFTIGHAISLLRDNYNDDVRKIFDRVLIDCEVSNSEKLSIIKVIIDNDVDKKINFVLDNYYASYDFNLPDCNANGNLINGYYHALACNFIASINPSRDAKKIVKKLKLLSAIYEKYPDNFLKSRDEQIIGALLCYNNEQEEWYSSTTLLSKFYNLDEEELITCNNVLNGMIKDFTGKDR